MALRLPFTNRVRSLRDQKGLTQEQLVLATGKTRATIGNVESHQLEPDADTMWRIARVLEVEVTALFFFVDEKPSIITRALRHATQISKGLALIIVLTLATFYGSAAYAEIRGDIALAQGDYMNSQLFHFTANTFIHPFVASARFKAINAAAKLGVGESRGYLTPLPSVDGCQSWLNKFDTVASEAPIDDTVGLVLHEDLADCLDRVKATGEAYNERMMLVHSPSPILARLAESDYYLIVRQAVFAKVMQDQIAAQRLLELARATHPDLYARWIRMWVKSAHASIDIAITRAIIADSSNDGSIKRANYKWYPRRGTR